jgi:hypothetical protein
MADDGWFFANTENWEGQVVRGRSLVQWRRRNAVSLENANRLEEINVTENRVSGFLYYEWDKAYSKINGRDLRGDFCLRHGEGEWRELISLSIAALKKMALQRLIETDNKLDMLYWKVK